MVDEGPSLDDLARFDDDRAYCPVCGEEVWDQAEFCPECGEQIGGATSSKPPEQRAAQSRLTQITVAVILLGFVPFLLVLLLRGCS